MRSFGALLLALVLSGLIAAAVQVQLGIVLKADLELVLAMVLLAVMTPLTTLVLGIALGVASSVAWIDRMAGILLGLVALAVTAMLIWEFRARDAIARSTLEFLVEIAVPLVIMIAIQWWLIRRHWRRAHTEPPPS